MGVPRLGALGLGGTGGPWAEGSSEWHRGGGSQSGELPKLKGLVVLGHLWGPMAGDIEVHG